MQKSKCPHCGKYFVFFVNESRDSDKEKVTEDINGKKILIIKYNHHEIYDCRLCGYKKDVISEIKDTINK